MVRHIRCVEKKTPVARFDVGAMQGVEKLPNGFLRAPAYLTRVGIFEYRRADGSKHRELRLPEEVFSPEAMASFAMVPLTDDHPPAGHVDAENIKATATIGHLGENIERDGKFVRGRVMVTDSEAVRKILEKEKTELSCGYTCDLEEAPGVWGGQPYDAVQRNIRGNHVALVTKGRAGPEVRVRLDSAAAIMVIDEAGSIEPQFEGAMTKIRIDGLEFEMPETSAQAVSKELAKKDAEIAETRKAKDAAVAKADALEAEMKKGAEALKAATDPAKRRAEIAARVSLEKKASEILGDEPKLDEMDDLEVKKAVIAKLSPDADLDGKSADYIAARFDLAVEHAGEAALGEVQRKVTDAEKREDGPKTIDEKRGAFHARLATSYKRSK